MKLLPLWFLTGACTLALAACGNKDKAASTATPPEPQAPRVVNNANVQHSQTATTVIVENPAARVVSVRSEMTNPVAASPPDAATNAITLNVSETTEGNTVAVHPAPVIAPAAPAPATALSDAAAWTRLSARSGSKVRIEGTSTVHDWQVESPLIGGYVDVGPGFPTQPGESIASGTIPVRGEAFVTARSLKSVLKDGKPYSDSMDQIMHEKLLAEQHPRLTFTVTGLSVNVDAASGSAPSFQMAGELRVAGVARTVQAPVTIEPASGGRVKISGVLALKMTDFKIEPPRPVGIVLVTADDVKVLFEWMVAPRQPLAAK